MFIKGLSIKTPNYVDFVFENFVILNYNTKNFSLVPLDREQGVVLYQNI